MDLLETPTIEQFIRAQRLHPSVRINLYSGRGNVSRNVLENEPIKTDKRQTEAWADEVCERESQ